MLLTGGKVIGEGPRTWREDKPLVVLGGAIVTLVPGYVIHYTLTVEYMCDNTGGNTVPTTWIHDGETYDLIDDYPEIGRTDRLGTWVAIYERVEAWAAA